MVCDEESRTVSNLFVDRKRVYFDFRDVRMFGVILLKLAACCCCLFVCLLLSVVVVVLMGFAVVNKHTMELINARSKSHKYNNSNKDLSRLR